MDCKIVVVTFNVNMKPPTKDAVNQMLSDLTSVSIDILVVGLQEVAHAETIGGAPVTWHKMLLAWATEFGRLALLTKTYQATNQIFVFAQRKMVTFVRRIDYRFARNTMGGLTGHKGSIGVRLQLKSPLSIAFVTSHFVHDAAAYERRLVQFRANELCAFSDDASVRNVFWLGDLNFRVDHDTDDVLNLIDSNKFRSLLDEAEQLKRAQRNGDAFQNYIEQPITFRPTYRLLVGTSTHDSKRTPSWCDRILYKGSGIEPISYKSNETVQVSDHFPVIAVFNLKMPIAPRADWDVVFEHLPTWYTSIPLIGRFQINPIYWKKNGSYRDWVGLFPASLDDCTSAMSWSYVATCYQQVVEDEKFCVCEFSNLDSGKYRLGYFSCYSNCLVGISKAFKIIEQP